MTVTFCERFDVDDEALSALHAAAFGGCVSAHGWRHQLAEHSLTWVGAFEAGTLVGFVNVVWDGGAHAFVLDTAVAPPHQDHGIGRELVRRAGRAASEAGCRWLHVDFAPEDSSFYLDACGLTPTPAGLLELSPSPG